MKEKTLYISNGSLTFIHLQIHHCPKCGKKLEPYFIIANAGSDTARRFGCDLEADGKKPVNLVIRCFRCPECTAYVPLEDVKRAEGTVAARA
ncbi:MAG: hypothetical protein IJU52_02585 [Clostridia bacterium]|nr:hypothetical protein [Clostridia bacterium]